MAVVLYLAINGATEEELVIGRMKVQCCHKIRVPADKSLHVMLTWVDTHAMIDT